MYEHIYLWIVKQCFYCVSYRHIKKSVYLSHIVFFGTRCIIGNDDVCVYLFIGICRISFSNTNYSLLVNILICRLYRRVFAHKPRVWINTNNKLFICICKIYNMQTLHTYCRTKDLLLYYVGNMQKKNA